jgi:uncharacterized repeat protein (TIGR01451 family)
VNRPFAVRFWAGAVCLLPLFLAPSQSWGQALDITWYTVDGGGATFSTGGTYSLGGTIGQPDASGPLAGGNFSVIGGFWGVAVSLADLSITKTDGLASAVPGQSVTYTIVVSNAGPDPDPNAQVVDTLPAEITAATWTCVGAGGGTCPASGTGNINNLLNLPSGGSVTYTVTATISPSATGSLSNTASVTPSGAVVDGNPGNNSATDMDTLVAQADLSITKTDGQSSAYPGQVVTYVIAASNAGPSNVTAATVADALPASITGATWTCAGSGGGTCTASGSGPINDSVNLPVGASVTYTLTGTISPSATGSVANTATVTVPGGVTDPVPGNNSSTDTDSLIACGAGIVVVPDGRLTRSVLPTGATGWFQASVRLGNSYSVEFKNATGDTTPPGAATVYAGSDPCAGPSSVTATNTSGIDPGGSTAMARLSFTAGAGSTFRAGLVNGSGLPIPFSFSWSDTTLFSPAWSDNGSFDTFYSFLNTTGTSLNGSLTLLDTAGVVVTTFNITIPSGQTASTSTAALLIPRNKTGTARFTHNGPPGAVVAESAIANFTISPAYTQPVKFQAMRESTH